MIALTAGLVRTITLSYNAAFALSAILCLAAALTALAIGGQDRRKRREASEHQQRENGPAIPAGAPA